MPVYLRPERTKRAILSVLAQDFKGYEIIIVSDGCPYFKRTIDSGWLQEQLEAYHLDESNRIEVITLAENHADYGSYARWMGIQKADSNYILFLDNDDMILTKHFDNYCGSMESIHDVGLGYFNSYVEPLNYIRLASLQYGAIGHAEIVVKTDIIKQLYTIDGTYGHDWRLIERIKNNGVKTMHFNTTPTYIVKSIDSQREIGID